MHVADLLRQIDTRLDELEAERKHLLGLRRIYAGSMPIGVTESGNGGPVLAQPRTVLPPVPPSEKVRLNPANSGKKTGISALILRVVGKHPSLDVSQLTTRIIEHIDGAAPARSNIRGMLKYLVDTRQLLRADDGTYSLPASDGQGGLLDMEATPMA